MAEETPPETLPCWVYRSSRKQEMYLYLASEEGFDAVPAALRKRFGSPALVMELTLHPGLKLAREETTKVIDNLRGQGYHLQLPPDIQANLYRGD